MKRFMVGVLTLTMVIGLAVPSYASDWDKAGKALAVIEGVRILTGGNVDLIGTFTGINRPRGYAPSHPTPASCQPAYHKRPQKAIYRQAEEREWVPRRVVWQKEYIPEHTEYSEEYGEVIVEGHYIRYQVEEGGYWISRR
ncbi:MAG: hypothetical protein JW844_07850 [Candidatus Omnitrophica bacterium]|nr:hypothetical protein [Candidatus Omnitrophota bacterium]